MFKRILKIVGIVLGCTVVGVGILTGVLALQGKFKKPYQEPNSIYFDIDENVLNVTYYCNNFVASQMDPNYELLRENPTKNLNVYSFVLKATPDDVTELDCTMVVEKGSELIEFCSANGKAYANGVRSNVKIGERVYFRIKNTFDNSIADNTTANYETTNGEVKLYFNTSNNLHNAYLTIKIDRQASQVSLFDSKNPMNNIHSNGVFSYENGKYENVASPKESDKSKYFVREVDATGSFVYRQFGRNLDGTAKTDEVFDTNATNYYVYNSNTTLNITVEANTDYKLQPIFAPDNSNKPFKDKTAKLCEMYYYDKNTGNYYLIGDASHSVDYITQKSDGYYFNANQAGNYEMYLVSYPTYDVQKLFENNFESDNVSDKIFNNSYAITRKVVFTVENSGVQEVYFNAGNTLNMNFELFKDNYVAVHNSAVAKNLDISMLNNNGETINSRFNQLEFLNKSHFVAGNVTFVNGNKTISIGENSTSATVSGFADVEGVDYSKYNGSHAYTLEYGSKQLLLTIKVLGEQDLVLAIPCEISTANMIYKIDTESKVATDSLLNLSWRMNDVLLVNVETKNEGNTPIANYTLGTLAVGSYLVMTQGEKAEFVNDKFSFVSSNYGINKQFNIIPLEHLTEVSMYCLIVNKDFSAVWTNQPVNIQINYESAELSRVFENTQPLKINVSAGSQSYNVEDLVQQTKGSYRYPLMFVENSNIKVKTIPQIYFFANGKTFVLVGEIDKGIFVNKVVPLPNVIGTQNVYVRMIKYNYNQIRSYNDLFAMLCSNAKISTNEPNRTFYEKVDLTTAPNNWNGYYKLNKVVDEGGATTNVSIEATTAEEIFDTNTIYLRKTDYVFIGAYVDDNGIVGQVSTVKVVEGNAVEEPNKLSVIYNKIIDNQVCDTPISIELNDTIDSLVGCEDFNSNPIAELNIIYVDKIDPDDEQEANSNLSFSLDFYQNTNDGIKLVEDKLQVLEGQQGKKDGADQLYAKIYVNNNYKFKDLIGLIADINEEKMFSAGLNQYYTLRVDMLNYANGQLGNVYRSSKLICKFDTDGNPAYRFENDDINQYFKVKSISYEQEESGKYIKVVFDVGQDDLDVFEDYGFKFVFEYGESQTTSLPIYITSTAVQGYQFKNGANNYSFNDYKIVYKIGYDGGYTYKAYLTPKQEYLKVNNPTADNIANYYIYDKDTKSYQKVEDGAEFSPIVEYYEKTETIELSSGGSLDGKLVDAKLLEINNHSSSFFTTINSNYNTEEFDFNITNSNDKVLNIVGNEIEILSKGNATITLTNKVKTSVQSQFEIVVDASDFDLTCNANQSKQEVSQSVVALDDNSTPIFQYQYGAKNPKTQLFNTEGLVNLAIKNVQPIEFAVSENGKQILDKTTQYSEVKLSEKPADWSGYYTYDIATNRYLSVDANAEFDATISYYKHQNAVVLSIQYNGGNWQLIRNENYVLSVFSFDLVVSTQFTDDCTCRFSYISPVVIEQNANNPMCNSVITYYQGTNLQLSAKNTSEESKKTLFKLTDNTGDGTTTQFSLQIEWYKQLVETKPFDVTRFYKYSNGRFTNIEPADEDDFRVNPSNYYEWGWIDVVDDSFVLSLNNDSINKISHLAYDTNINARIYYNANKYYTFQFVMKHNVFVEANTLNNAQKSSNSAINPQIMNAGDEIAFADILNVKQLISAGKVYYDYIADIDYEVIDDVLFDLTNANEMFEATTESKLKLVWVNTTGKNTYTTSISVTVDGVVFKHDYYVQATSNYTISAKNSLPTLDACQETNFDVTNYFDIKKDGASLSNFSAIISCYQDSLMQNEDNNLHFGGGKIAYSYPYISNGERFIVLTFTFIVDGKARTLTNNIAYPININNYELTRSSKILSAGNLTSFVDLFDDFDADTSKLITNVDDIWKIVLEDNNSINYYGEPELTSSQKILKIQPKIKGEDYLATVQVYVYYDQSNPDLYYTYQLNLQVKNPTKAQIENVMFDDLKLNINNDLLDLDGNSIDFVGKIYYQPVLAGEIVGDLSNKFVMYDAEDKKLTDSKYALSNIELFGTINLVGDPNYKNKITINNTAKTIAIGDFTRVGYAVFKLSDKEGTSCYYALRITPSTMSISEKYTSVIKTINGQQQRTTLDYKKETSGSNVNEFLKSNYTNMALATGVAESVLTSNNIYYYLLSTDQVGADGKDYIRNSNGESMLNKVVNNCDINPVSNPTQFTLAVLIKTSNAEVYLCNVNVTVMPNVTISLDKDTKTLDGNYTYSRNIKYSYDKGATNALAIANILTVDGATVGNVSIQELKDNDINAIISGNNIVDETTNDVILAVNANNIVLNKNVSKQLSLTLQLTYSNDLIVTLHINYLPFENINTTRTYKLGWNGTKFEHAISRYVLIPDYNGNIEATLDGGSLSLSGDNYEFTLTEVEQTKTLILSLDDIQGEPTYSFTIILAKNINQSIYYGKTQDDSVKTIIDSNNNNSTLTLLGNGTQKLSLTTGSTQEATTIAVFDYEGNIVINNVVFYNLLGQATDFVEYKNNTLTFIASASDIDGKLIIDTNIGEIEIYVTMVKTYTVEANYRITKTVAGVSTNAQYETVKVNSTLKFDDFISTELNALTLDNVTINKCRFAVKKYKYEELTSQPADWESNYSNYFKLVNGAYAQLLQKESYANDKYYQLTLSPDENLSRITDAKDSNNRINWQVMFASPDGMVADSNNVYHILDTNNNTITFKNAGTVYIRLTNNTGLQLDYQINIQDDAYFVDNISWNIDNPNTDMTIEDGKITKMPTYFATDIATLTDSTQDGYKLASLTFNPSDVTDLTYFRMYVNKYTKNGAEVGGQNTYDSSDETRGSFKVEGGITLNYIVKNFNIMLTVLSTTKFDDIEFAELELYFVTINGVSTTIKLYITNTTITPGVDIGLENIYANQEELSLSTILSNGKKRLAISNYQADANNIEEIEYNNGNNAKYNLYFNGWKNETTGQEYTKDNSSLVVVNNSDNYNTDAFSLRSIATDNNISLHYYLTYNNIIIATFNYSFVIKNDINITMNNFDNTGTTSIGDIYLNNYDKDSGNNFKIDLINKTDGTYYRNEYLVYKNLRTNKSIFEGDDTGKTIANYMKFELVTSYFATGPSHNSYNTRDKFISDEVSIDENGILTVKADKSGKIGVKVTAQNCPTYSIIFELNVHATINVAQKYSDTEYDSGAGGYSSLSDINLISYDTTDKNAMIYLDKTYADSSYTLKNGEISESAIKIELEYAIKSSIGEAGTFAETSATFTNKMMKLKLPVVPFSSAERYIVSYKVTITQNGTARTYYANYLVKNSDGMQEREFYQSKIITVGVGAQTGANLTIYQKVSSNDDKNTNTSLFTGQDATPTLLGGNGATLIRFENIIDATGARNTKEMSIKNNANVYQIDLGNANIFSNQMTFDIVFLNASKQELYRSAGWTMQADGQVKPKNQKALLDLFTEAELGNELLDKNFVAVTNENDDDPQKVWFENATKVEIKSTSWEVRGYTIYSFTATASGGGAFYNLQGTFYFISGSPTNFIEITDNYYISYIIEDSSKDLALDVNNYAKVFRGADFGTEKITKIELVVENTKINIIDNTKISIESGVFKSLANNNRIEFSIKITGGNGGEATRIVKVILTLPSKS